jgi:AraC family transcriptional regulator of arabinose operon
MLDHLGLPSQGVLLQDKTFFETLARRCAITAEREEEGLSQRQTVLYVEQILLHLWEESARPTADPRDNLIRKIHADIRAAPGEDWNISMQAERACLSRSQYTRRFLQLLGIAPRQFVIRCRLDRASQLLLETDMTISEIAKVLGYRDLFFFSRQFKAYFGVSPGMQRRLGR